MNQQNIENLESKTGVISIEEMKSITSKLIQRVDELAGQCVEDLKKYDSETPKPSIFSWKKRKQWYSNRQVITRNYKKDHPEIDELFSYQAKCSHLYTEWSEDKDFSPRDIRQCTICGYEERRTYPEYATR